MSTTLCVGGRRYSESINQNLYEDANPKTKKLVKIIEGICSYSGRSKSQIFTTSKWREDKISKKSQNVNMDIVVFCQIQHGVIQIVMELFWNYMISAQTLNVIARKLHYPKTIWIRR